MSICYLSSIQHKNILEIEESVEYTSNYQRKTKRSQHVTSSTWKPWGDDRLCPKIFPDIVFHIRVQHGLACPPILAGGEPRHASLSSYIGCHCEMGVDSKERTRSGKFTKTKFDIGVNCGGGSATCKLI
jgi:hypothetical protein